MKIIKIADQQPPSLLLQSEVGKGANFLGKIHSIIITIFSLLGGLSSRGDVVGNYGRQLKSGSVTNYLENLKLTNEKFDYFSTFATEGNEFEGTQKDIEKLHNGVSKAEFEGTIPFLDPSSKATQLAIPLVFTGFEKHIVMVLIDKDKKTIDYFDSKGITSEHKVFKNGTTMKSILEGLAQLCQEKDHSEYTIQENAKVLQMDTHNCGAYVSWFAEQRISKTAETIINEGINRQSIRGFRAQMKASIQSAKPIDETGKASLALPEEDEF